MRAIGCRPALCCVTVVLLVGSTVPALADPKGEIRRVEAVLDDFHEAAAKADGERYFSHLAPSGVFLGTDASERWTKSQFQAFAEPYFAQGTGWAYTPRDRHVVLAADGKTAWFDELLDNESYGECRGTGALQLYDGEWKIEQYHLTIPMPNDLAKDFVARIREHAGSMSP
ncbi:MAG: nuclear transport factor 2 family protein [Acidobacteriota bacterium]